MKTFVLLTFLSSWTLLYERDPGSLRSIRNATEFNELAPKLK